MARRSFSEGGLNRRRAAPIYRPPFTDDGSLGRPVRGAALQSQFLLDLFNTREEFPEPADTGNLLFHFIDGTRGITEPGASRNTLGDATLRCNHTAVGDFDVADNADLSRHRDALAHTGAA